MYYKKMQFILKRIVIIKILLILIILEILSSLLLKKSYTYRDLLKLGEAKEIKSERSTAHPRIYEYSEYLPFTLPKNFNYRHHFAEFDVRYKFNKFGYRGLLPTKILKNQKNTRVLFLGDSFTFGFGVRKKDTFVELNNFYSKNRNIEFLNAGYHAGNSLDSYYAYLKNEGVLLAPSMALIFIYSGNDIDDIREHVWKSLDDNGLPRKVRTKRNFINYEGEFFFLKDKLITPWNYQIPLLNNSKLFISLTNIANQFILPKKNIKNLLEGSYYELMPIEVAKKKFQLSLIGINKFLKERKILPIFFVIPEARAYPKRTANYKVSLSKHTEIIEMLLKLPGLKFIDLYPYLTHEDYFNKDAHFNHRGHFKVYNIIDDLNIFN
jgi:hypothetical protein